MYSEIHKGRDREVAERIFEEIMAKNSSKLSEKLEDKYPGSPMTYIYITLKGTYTKTHYKEIVLRQTQSQKEEGSSSSHQREAQSDY
jgi:hypothetical protein